MAYPSLEELLAFEENVFLPRGLEISQLERFPRNFNPFVLKQYLADAHQHPEEYRKLLSFYKEVASPLEEKKHAAQQELQEGEPAPRGAMGRLESVIVLPHTLTMGVGDCVQKITGSFVLGGIFTISSIFAGLSGTGYISAEAQVAYICSLIAGFYREHNQTMAMIKRTKHFMEQIAKKQEDLDCLLKRDFPLIFGRGYYDLDTLGREIYVYFEGKRN